MPALSGKTKTPVGSRPKRAGSPRRKGTPQPPAGLAKGDPRQDPDFIKWNATAGGGIGTYPEYLIYRYLERRLGYRPGIEFQYLAVVGGARQLEGVQVDFLIQNWLALAVDGTYFHFANREQIESNFLARATVQSAGYVFVSAVDSDIIDRLDAVMTAALAGQELPTAVHYRTGL